MGRRNRSIRRTPLQTGADDASQDLMRKLGRMLKDGRGRHRMTQAQAAARAGISRSEWSGLERGKQPATIPTMNRAAFAIGGNLEAYVKATSAADLPRDAVHLRHQELILRLAVPGGWTGLPEELIDHDARTSRAADVLLYRRNATDGVHEYAFWDVWDWFDDVGGPVRDFGRRMEAVDRYAVARMPVDTTTLPRISGVFVVRATSRNRVLIAAHRHFFRSRFPGSAHEALQALQNPAAPLPKEPALVWVAVNGDRLFPSRLR